MEMEQEETLQRANPFLEKLMRNLQAHPEIIATSSTTFKSPLEDCDLDNFDCPFCNNTGNITARDEKGILWSRECECMKKRRSIRRIKTSGLQDMVERYSFKNYRTDTRQQEGIKQRAQEFITSDVEAFFISGRPGSGKTHICTAICSELINEGWDVKYMMWRTDGAELKAMITEREEYKRAIRKLRDVQVLYIDDFFKGAVSDGDINLAFAILNERYNSKGKKTIISSERSMQDILRIDDAIGGRIAERARGFIIQSPNENWRTSK